MFTDVIRRMGSALLPMLLFAGLMPSPAAAQTPGSAPGLYERFVQSVATDRSDDVAALLYGKQAPYMGKSYAGRPISGAAK